MRGIQIEFREGLNPEAKVITIAHRNNPKYTNEILIAKVQEFAKNNSIRVLTLNENKQKLLKDREFADFDKHKLFL